mgnify:CR=1 FL=1
MQTVVETPSYLADAERLFSLDERKAIVDRLAAMETFARVVELGSFLGGSTAALVEGLLAGRADKLQLTQADIQALFMAE